MKNKLLDELAAARRVGVPLLRIATPDAVSLVGALCPKDGGPLAGDPVVQWDCMRGLRAANERGKQAINDAGIGDPAGLRNLEEMLKAAESLPGCLAMAGAGDCSPGSPCARHTVVIVHNAQNHLADNADGVLSSIQGIANLREAFKADARLLILLGPEVALPPEIDQDVIGLRELFPDDAVLQDVITFAHEQSKLPLPDAETQSNLVAGLRGLSRFGAEQIAMMALRKGPDGWAMNLDAVWDRKIETVNLVDGLTLEYRTGIDPDTVKGLDHLVGEYLRRQAGPEPIRCVMLLDEIEKTMGGSGGAGSPGDSSGVQQEYLRTLLKMDDLGWSGILGAGGPGVGKTHLGRSIAGILGVPFLRFDPSACKGSLVGESERKLRRVFDVAHAISGSAMEVIGTCNGLSSLPSELLRRFRGGIYYFPMPDAETLADLWAYYRDKYGITDKPTGFESSSWTGAEVRNCCERARMMGYSLAEAAKQIRPISVSRRAQMEALEAFAEGNLTCARNGGAYSRQRPVSSGPRRAVNLGDLTCN